MSDVIAEQIRSKLSSLNPQVIDVVNESHMHAGPARDSHYKLVVVSDDFDGKRPVARHQLIYSLLADEMAGPVHALAMHLYAPQEWQGQVPLSPNCAGKNI